MITVIVPTHNQAEFIEETLDSITAQTYRKFEVIIINDSSDDTEKIVLNYIRNKKPKDIPMIHIKVSPCELEDKLNLGFKMASHQHLAYLASDDKWFPEFLYETKKALDCNPDVGLVYTNFSWRYMGKDNHTEERAVLVNLDQINNAPLIETNYGGLFWLFRKEVWQKVKFRGMIEGVAHDYDFLLRVEEAGFKIKLVSKELGWFRVHSKQASNNHVKTDELTAHTKILAIERRNGKKED